jgi:hypothetical protein
MEFDGHPPFQPGSRYVKDDASIFPVTMFPFIWDMAAALSRLVRRVSSEEEVKLLPTFYAIHLRRGDGVAQIAVFSWEGKGEVHLADTELDLLELAGTYWGLANSMVTTILLRNPTLKGNLLITRFSQTVSELFDAVVQRGWQGPGHGPSP